MVYRGQPGDMYIAAMHDDTPGYERDFVYRPLATGDPFTAMRRA